MKQLGDILGLHEETQIFLLLFATIAVLIALIVFIAIIVRAGKRKKKKQNALSSEEPTVKEKQKNKLKEEKTTVAPAAEKKEETKKAEPIKQAEKAPEESKKAEQEVEKIPVIEPIQKTEETPKVAEPIKKTPEKTPEELRKEIEAGKEQIASREENLRKIQERLKELGLKSNDFYASEQPTTKQSYNETKKQEAFDNEGGIVSKYQSEPRIELEPNLKKEEPVVGKAQEIDLTKTATDQKRIDNFTNEGGPALPIPEEKTEEKDTQNVPSFLNEGGVNSEFTTEPIQVEENKTESNEAVENSVQIQDVTENFTNETNNSSTTTEDNTNDDASATETEEEIEAFADEGGAIPEIKEIEQVDTNHDWKERTDDNAQTIAESTTPEEKQETKLEKQDEQHFQNDAPKTFSEWLNSVSAKQ